MARKLNINYKAIVRQISAAARYIWRQTVVYNAVMLVIVGLLFSFMLAQAFKTYFNCNYLIRDSLGIPSFICDGQNFLVVDIPGLARVMDGPLEAIRRGMLWVVLFLFIAISGYLTLIINNLKKVVKLVTLDKREWQGLLSVMRIFITILVILNVLFFIWIMV